MRCFNDSLKNYSEELKCIFGFFTSHVLINKNTISSTLQCRTQENLKGGRTFHGASGFNAFFRLNIWILTFKRREYGFKLYWESRNDSQIFGIREATLYFDSNWEWEAQHHTHTPTHPPFYSPLEWNKI